MMTVAVRDLQKAHPVQFLTDVRTSAQSLWANNSYLTGLLNGDGIKLRFSDYLEG